LIPGITFRLSRIPIKSLAFALFIERFNFIINVFHNRISDNNFYTETFYFLFLINISAISLTYGSKSDASLDSYPRLYSGDDETSLKPPSAFGGRGQVIEGALLGIKRSVDECDMLNPLFLNIKSGKAGLADFIINVPQIDPLFSPVINTVALQLLAYYVARERGCPIDFPRNLAKSVTVE
jgi:hypothetical protein